MSSEPLIINLAPTGMVPTKELTPHVPTSTEEILEDVERCRAHGVAIVHVHARDEDGRPSHRAEQFAPIVAGMRAIRSSSCASPAAAGSHPTSTRGPRS
jgi:3-keto-5-aminohexanoate cleavage enzyme